MKTIVAKPFIKWAGGKQAIADLIISRFPNKIDRYFEPFLGGGSILLATKAVSAVANDANAWLVNTYMAVREDWQRVAQLLEAYPNTKMDFLRIREESRTSRGRWQRAAQFIYLNKTCFRGLFRVNKKNQFNVPYGDYDRRYFSPENLGAVADALQSVEFRSLDFEFAIADASKNDFIYLDPPYYKLGGHSDFNRYTAGQFRAAEHLRLASLCRELDNRGVRWLLSNSNTSFVKELFAGFTIEETASRRDINLKSQKRKVTELLISNY